MIKRYYTKPDNHPFDGVKWVTTTAEIVNLKNPEKSFKQEGVEFPDYFSQNAINIVTSKYFIGKLGTPEREFSLKQLINRVVNKNVEWGVEQGYFTKKESRVYSDELIYMLLHQIYSFNTPVYLNIGNPNSRDQVSACFVLGIEDTMESIEENIAIEMEVYRSGSGTGTNYSKLRSSRESIKGGIGIPSGPNSFMKISDAGAGVTKSGGLTRRAAQLKRLDVDHGDIREFIWQKKVEEDKAKALIAAGWSSDFDDPKGAYGSVFFQNSNQSVGVTDEFMNAVEKKQDWNLLTRKDKKVLETLKADDLFTDIAKCTFETGDPAVQFHDAINKYNTCSVSGEINSSNP